MDTVGRLFENILLTRIPSGLSVKYCMTGSSGSDLAALSVDVSKAFITVWVDGPFYKLTILSC
jgi:hypothetical protein